ncbi:MAG TPA: hypothetical protein VK428_10385 [Acidimicrobiales bacterium]|nr:hypothetical protein [Acidimicrobiales bacterium]
MPERPRPRAAVAAGAGADPVAGFGAGFGRGAGMVIPESSSRITAGDAVPPLTPTCFTYRG